MPSKTMQTSSYKLTYPHSGSVLVRYASRIVLVPNNFGLIIPVDEPHTLQATPDAVVQDVLLHASTVPRQFSPVACVGLSRLAMGLVNHLTELPIESPKRRNAEVVLLDLITPSPPTFELNLPTEPGLLRAAEHALRHPVDPHSILQCMNLAGVSSRTFTRQFRAQTKISWVEWCHAVKMFHAMSLVSQGISIGQVSHDVAYRTPSTFTVAFTRFFASNPINFKPHRVCEKCGHMKFRRRATDRTSLS